jgi:hypothetical protein
MHLFWASGELTLYGLTILFTGLVGLVSSILCLIGRETDSQAVWGVGMLTLSVALGMALVCLLCPYIFLVPYIHSLLDGAMHGAIAVLAALAFSTGLVALSIATKLMPHANR